MVSLGWAIFHGWVSFGVSLLIGFYSMLRTGEILGILSSHIECAPGALQALIDLGLTNGGKRHGAAESVVLGSDGPSLEEGQPAFHTSYTLARTMESPVQPVYS